MKMKFNWEGFMFIAMGMLSLICLYYAIITRHQLSSLFTYLALALLFGAGSLYYRGKTKFESSPSDKVEKKDRTRKRKR